MKSRSWVENSCCQLRRFERSRRWLLADQKLRWSSRVRRGRRRVNDGLENGSEQVGANCGAHSGIVGLYTIISVLPGYLITLPSLGTTSFQSQPRQTHLVGGTDTNRLRWV